MFWRRFRQGSRFASWKIIPISLGRGPVTGRPSSRMRPRVSAWRPGHRPEERRLAAAAGAEDADELALGNRDREVLERVNGPALRRVDLRRVADADLLARRHGRRAQNHPASSGSAYCMNSTTAPSTSTNATRTNPSPDVEGLGEDVVPVRRLGRRRPPGRRRAARCGAGRSPGCRARSGATRRCRDARAGSSPSTRVASTHRSPVCTRSVTSPM